MSSAQTRVVMCVLPLLDLHAPCHLLRCLLRALPASKPLPAPLSCLAGEAKRQFLAGLTSSVNEVFPFLCRMLEQHFLAANDARAKGNNDELSAHTAGRAELATWGEGQGSDDDTGFAGGW